MGGLVADNSTNIMNFANAKTDCLLKAHQQKG
jgi:hypothetical protein